MGDRESFTAARSSASRSAAASAAAARKVSAFCWRAACRPEEEQVSVSAK